MPRRDAQAAPLGAVFAVNGAVYGSLLPRYPQIADHVGATTGQFGLALAGIGVGGVTGAFVATRAVRAIGGHRRALLVAGLAFLAAGVGVAAAPSLALLTVAFAALGLFDGFVDTAMNQAGASLRERTGVSVMGRLHASLAAATLVATGAGALVAGTVSVLVHLLAVAACLLVVLLVALRALPASPPPALPSSGAAPSQRTACPYSSRSARPSRRGRGRGRGWAVVVLAGLAAVLIELPAQEWSGLLLARELGAGATVAGAGPLVAVAGVLASRLGLDRAVDALGWGAVARLSGGLAAAGTIAALMLGAATREPAALLAGLGIAAVGAGAAVPLLFDRAGHLAARVGLAADAGAGLVSGVFRLGVLVSPLLVGAVAASAGLFLALGVTAVAGVMIASLAGPLTQDHPR